VSAFSETAPAVPVESQEFEAFEPVGEIGKLTAFLRRDFLIAWSYRTAFFAEAGSLVAQALTFWFIGRLISPSVLPTYDGSRVGYMEFVASGFLLFAFVEMGMSQVSSSIRQEQLMGTLESVLLTPTAIATIQSGSALYASIYVPIRTALFFGSIALAFGVHFSPGGIVPAALILLVFLPFVWGLGITSAAAMLTFRRGGLGINFLTSILTLGSGAFFPLTLLPSWLQAIAGENPLARAINGVRSALIAGSWSGLHSDLLVVGIASVITFSIGLLAFKLALERERRRGTLGVY